MNRPIAFLLPLALSVAPVLPLPAQLDDANSLYGIHWYGPSDPSIDLSGTTDAENMAPGEEMWVLEITHLDTLSPDPAPGSTGVQANPWDRPEWFNGYGSGGHLADVTGGGKGHSLLFRIHPNWSRNVPYFEAPGSPNNDPFTLADYAGAAANAAAAFSNHVRLWQLGNEVNLTIENKRWNPSSERYDIEWTPDPALYAETYLAVRDAIHTVAPNMNPSEQIVLMQPVSPGLAGNPSIRYMDGVEFLWRMIEAVPPADRGRIDGFALHSYAEPGGLNDGVDGYMDALREQIMVINELGLHDRPLFVTEFNKHMPDLGNTYIGARFAQKSFQAMHEWNTGTGGAWPGQPNHDIAGAMWFVFYDPGSGWADYALQTKKAEIASTDPNQNPWYGFQAAATNDYPAGSLDGGGAIPDREELWWEDDFATLDLAPPLPDWRTATSGFGSTVTASGGALRLRGSNSGGGGSVFSHGYVYGDLRLEVEFEITDGSIAPNSALPGEANFEIRLREGSRGYSLTFYSDASDAARRNRVVLRRTNEWSTINGLSEEIGIATGDRFRVEAIAQGDTLAYRIYKNGAVTPIVDWTTTDDQHNVGWVRVGTYNMTEARVEHLAVGGAEWAGAGPLAAQNWILY